MTSTIKNERRGTNRSEAGQAPEVARRLVVELSSKAAQDLAWLVEEEELNKTTIVNRAVQVYKRIMELQARNGSIILDDPENATRERMLIV